MKRSILAILCLFPALAWGQAFPLFDPATGILKGQNNTYVTTAAISSDVIGLWTATCNSTTFLRGDGQCQTPSGSGIGTVTSVAMTWASSGISIGGSPITSAGTLALTGTLNVGTGGTGATTLTGVLKGNGTSAFTAATSADVISLWTGTCNSTTFLRADGSCQTVAGTTDASTLTSGTLADARLSANVPLKNAVSIFTNNSSNTGALQISTATPVYGWVETDAAADEKRWRAYAESGIWNLCTLTDAEVAGACAIAIDRTGTAIADINLTGTAVRANGNAILTTTSGLNGTNVTSGTVADARLSANVAVKNVANQSFSVVGNNGFVLENSSTGFGVVSIKTNGQQRIDMCTATSAAICSASDAANDSSIRFLQKLHLADNNGGNSVAIFDTAQIDLNATVVNANSSRINTVANSGKTAFAFIDGFAGTVTAARSLNVSAVSRTSAGIYVITLNAGFTQSPVCTVTTTGGPNFTQIGASSSTSLNLANSRYDPPSGTVFNDDSFFNLICHGP